MMGMFTVTIRVIAVIVSPKWGGYPKLGYALGYLQGLYLQVYNGVPYFRKLVYCQSGHSPNSENSP